MTQRTMLFASVCAVSVFISGCLGGGGQYAYQETTYDERVASAKDYNGPNADVADLAMGHLGVPYRFGGTTSRGLDCSGLVQNTYAELGKKLPRNSYGQYKATQRITRSELTKGDLVFFKTGRGNPITHVGIYMGGNQFLHAPSSGKDVQITSLSNPYWSRRYKGAGRVN